MPLSITSLGVVGLCLMDGRRPIATVHRAPNAERWALKFTRADELFEALVAAEAVMPDGEAREHVRAVLDAATPLFIEAEEPTDAR